MCAAQNGHLAVAQYLYSHEALLTDKDNVRYYINYNFNYLTYENVCTYILYFFRMAGHH